MSNRPKYWSLFTLALLGLVSAPVFASESANCGIVGHDPGTITHTQHMEPEASAQKSRLDETKSVRRIYELGSSSGRRNR